jgi:hypothetical protein
MKQHFLKTIVITTALAFSCSASFSQNVQYKVLTNDPDKLKPILIGFNALVADTWGTNSYMGIGAFAQVNILKYGSVNVDWTKAYLDMVKGIKNHRGIEIGLAYNLFSFKKNKNMQVVLSSSLTFTETRRTQSTTSLSVPGTAKKIVQLRAGLNNFKTATEDISAGGGGINFDLPPDFRVESWDATLKFNFMYSGISWHTINNLVINWSGNNLATNCNDYNFFFDLLYAPFINLEGGSGRVRSPNGGAQIMALNGMTLKPETKIKDVGWRFGWEARKNNIMGAFTYKVEFGARPGLTNSKKGLLSANSYGLLTAGFTFPAGKKIKITDDTKQ